MIRKFGRGRSKAVQTVSQAMQKEHLGSVSAKNYEMPDSSLPSRAVDLERVKRIIILAAETDTDDPMLIRAGDLIMETSQATVSMLYRELQLGYAYPARLLDIFEALEIVGPFEDKPRDILITPGEWELIKPYLGNKLPF